MSNLQPLDGIWLIRPDGAIWLKASDVSLNSVGAKAFGLTTIPRIWTPPFFALASDLFQIFKKNKGDSAVVLPAGFLDSVFAVGERIGIQLEDVVLLRSSAISENVEERGKFRSAKGQFRNIDQMIRTCCTDLINDPETASATICFVIQKEANPLSLRGHLSNERRLADEARDWIYEVEDIAEAKRDAGRIAIRKWREGEIRKPAPLVCEYEISIPEALRVPARWAHSKSMRVHFEWVWNGKQLYVVQADQATTLVGTNPTAVPTSLASPLPELDLRVFRKVVAADGTKFPKVHNVLVYRKLGFPTTDLFILDDPRELEKLASDVLSDNLVHDLRLLTQRPLVFRTDVNTDKIELRQMLPRTDEVRSFEAAVNHLTDAVKKVIASGWSTSQFGILAHHFIPAVTSAWSYAEPRSRKVFIEALWGIPEGLYYYSHDTFIVDTQHINPKKINTEEKKHFFVRERVRYKRHFVAPTDSGQWKTHTVAEPFDWRPSIRQRSWIRQIAYESRTIADYEGHPVNVMWFVDLPKTTGMPAILPWYHEAAMQKPAMRKAPGRKKFVTDQDYYIESTNDIDALERDIEAGQCTVRRIRIRPKDDTLLREKEFAKRIGDLARKIHAIIVLEGGLLSHTYYILSRTGAQVETVDNFPSDEEIQEYNKLVRDLIPRRISDYGEQVTVARLTGNTLIQELRKKLVEEAFEALEAPERESLIEELADVLEVITSLCKKLKVQKTEISSKQKHKKQVRGGFDEGYMLVETRNPPITEQIEGEASLLGVTEESQGGITEIKLPPAALDVLQRSIDKRQQGETTETMLTVEVPVVGDKWEATTGEFSVSDGFDTTLKVRSRLVGKRTGSTLRLELSIVTAPHQYTLFRDPGMKTTIDD